MVKKNPNFNGIIGYKDIPLYATIKLQANITLNIGRKEGRKEMMKGGREGENKINLSFIH